MAVHGEKQKIRHKNMTDGVVKNGGCHDEQKKIYIYIIINNHLLCVKMRRMSPKRPMDPTIR